MLGSEIVLLARRLRTRVLLVLLFLEPWLLGFLISQFGGGKGGGGGPSFLDLATHNGIFLTLASLSSLLTILLPLAVSLISSDSIAGEASHGTLRYILISPVSRVKLLVYKLVSSMVFVAVVCIGVAVSGLMAGSVFFPMGNVPLLSGQTVSFAHGVLLAFAASGLVATSLVSVVAIGLAMSTFTDVPVGATLGALGAIIISEILDNITQVKGIWPLLPTNYWLSFSDLFRYPIIYDRMLRDVLSQVTWLVFGFSIAVARFRYKDITS